MFEPALPISVSRTVLTAICLAILISFSGRDASAQCSQATGAEAAAFAQSSATAQGNTADALSSGSSSMSQTTPAVRIATDRAITVLDQTPLQVRTDLPISSRTARAGARLSFTVTRDVVVDNILVIPCGATVLGTVVEAKQAGRLVGASKLTLQLTTLNLGGRSYPLHTPPFKVMAASKTRPTMQKVTIGATTGALLADASVPPPQYSRIASNGGPPRYVVEKVTAAQRAEGDAIVAGIGAGIGAGIAAGSAPSIATIPAESELEFTLASPVAVYPVDQMTAVRLAKGVHPGGPVLYVRDDTR